MEEEKELDKAGPIFDTEVKVAEVQPPAVNAEGVEESIAEEFLASEASNASTDSSASTDTTTATNTTTNEKTDAAEDDDALYIGARIQIESKR